MVSVNQGWLQKCIGFDNSKEMVAVLNQFTSYANGPAGWLAGKFWHKVKHPKSAFSQAGFSFTKLPVSR